MNVTAKSNIQHDGQLYTKGQTLEVSEKQAADLLAAGVIEPVAGVKPTPVESIEVSGEPDEKKQEDVKEIAKNTEEVANLPIKAVGMKKTLLLGIARANGLEVENTATPTEIYNMIKAFREKSAVVAENTESKVEEKTEESTDNTPAEPSK